MANSNGPVIDMTPDGTFIEPPKPSRPPKPSLVTILVRLALFGLFLCIGAIVFWTAVFVIPVLIVLGAVGYFFARMQLRRS